MSEQTMPQHSVITLNRDRGLQAMLAHRALWASGIILIMASALCAFTPAACAQQRGEDIWGKGNDFSNAQGGVSIQPTPPAAGKVPKTAAWKAVCDDHFRNPESRNRAERERIASRYSSKAERDREWNLYVEKRDRQSRACADTWPGQYDLAMARGQVDGVQGPTGGGSGESCQAASLAVPGPCRGIVNAVTLHSPRGTSRAIPFNADGSLVVGEDEVVDLSLLDGGLLRLGPGARFTAAGCEAIRREGQSQGIFSSGLTLSPAQMRWVIEKTKEKFPPTSAPRGRCRTPALGHRG